MRTSHLLLIIAGFLAFGLFLWPGLYHYTAISGQSGSLPVRINRITGATQTFDGERWQDPPAAAPSATELPATVVSRLKADWSRLSASDLHLSLYNGDSRWHVFTVLASIRSGPLTKRPSDAVPPVSSFLCEEWTREYRVEVAVPPLAAGSASLPLGKDISICPFEAAILGGEGFQ
jgi:hypothetical protein